WARRKWSKTKSTNLTEEVRLRCQSLNHKLEVDGSRGSGRGWEGDFESSGTGVSDTIGAIGAAQTFAASRLISPAVCAGELDEAAGEERNYGSRTWTRNTSYRTLPVHHRLG